jgi:hypothetical protein
LHKIVQTRQTAERDFSSATRLDTGRVEHRAVDHGGKAPEGWRTPGRFAFIRLIEPRGSVVECGGPPPLSSTTGVLTFTNEEIYTFARELEKLHPDNRSLRTATIAGHRPTLQDVAPDGAKIVLLAILQICRA